MIYMVLIFPLFYMTIDCYPKNYDNYTLFQATPVSNASLEFLYKLEDLYKVNFWKFPGSIKMRADFVIAPDKKNDFMKEASKHKLKVKMMLSDVQRAFDEQTIALYMRERTESFNWRNYYRLEDIYNWLYDLKDKYRKILKVESIGKSAQNRKIMMARILSTDNQEGSRPKVIIEGGIHAREWISISVVTYFLNEILKASCSKNEKHKKIYNMYEWYFLPVVNPDGYEYTHKKDRMWRKNCRGVDLNRNFDYEFGSIGVSKSKDFDTYPGTHAFSEPESKVMRDFIKSHHDNLEHYLSFHAYSQLILIPYGDSREPRDNYYEVYKKSMQASTKMGKRYGTIYSPGLTDHTIGYFSSGSSADWAKKTFNVPYVITFELRDKGEYGFALPPSQILECCEEVMDGLWSFLTPTKDTPLREAGHAIVASRFLIIIFFAAAFVSQ